MTGRDDARDRPSHPTVDELADLREGLLPEAADATVRSPRRRLRRVRRRDRCARRGVDAPASRSALSTSPMPADVARAIDDALREAAASARRAPGADERTATAPTPDRIAGSSQPSAGWPRVAAAVVVRRRSRRRARQHRLHVPTTTQAVPPTRRRPSPATGRRAAYTTASRRTGSQDKSWRQRANASTS